MAICSKTYSSLISAAHVLHEIESAVNIALPEIAERHLQTVRQGAGYLLFCARFSNPNSGQMRLSDIPIGHILTISPEQAADVCTDHKPCLCRKECARAVRLYQTHAATLGFRPTAAVEAWTWFLLFKHRTSGVDCRLVRRGTSSAAKAAGNTK